MKFKTISAKLIFLIAITSKSLYAQKVTAILSDEISSSCSRQVVINAESLDLLDDFSEVNTDLGETYQVIKHSHTTYFDGTTQLPFDIYFGDYLKTYTTVNKTINFSIPFEKTFMIEVERSVSFKIYDKNNNFLKDAISTHSVTTSVTPLFSEPPVFADGLLLNNNDAAGTCPGNNISLTYDGTGLAYSYQWNVENGNFYSSSLSGNDLLIGPTANDGKATVSLKYENQCVSKKVYFYIESAIPKDFDIIGPNSCINTQDKYTYTISNETYATEWKWEIPQNWTILGGGGVNDKSISIKATGGSGKIKCTPKNAICNLYGTTQELNVYVSQAIFGDAKNWTQGFTTSQGYSPTYPRLIGDFNGDGRDDIIGFGSNAVAVGISENGYFSNSTWSTGFTQAIGYDINKNPRIVGDFNGDGKDDIVGFGYSEVAVGISNGTTFIPSNWSNGFTYNIGYDINKTPRMIGDFNGDGKDDIIGFGYDNVAVGISTGSSFNVSNFTDNFTYNKSWRVDITPRLIGDFNGDGKDDIVGFGYDDVAVGISDGSQFHATNWCHGFGYNVGYDINKTPRLVGDFNGDGKDDIIGIGYTDVAVGISTGTSFEVSNWLSIDENSPLKSLNLMYDQIKIGDYNGDGLDDLIGFTSLGVVIALSDGNSFQCPLHKATLQNSVGYGSEKTDAFRTIGNFDNSDECNGQIPKIDIIAFGHTDVAVLSLSSTSANTCKTDIGNIYKTNFSYQTSACQGESVSFWNLSDWHYTKIDWYIDGVYISSGSSLNYTFSKGGQHLVTLKTLTNDNIGGSITKKINITPRISSIQGPSLVCLNEANVTFSIPNSQQGNYTWNAAGLPFTTSNGGTTITISSMQWAGTIQVSQTVNGCWSASYIDVATKSCQTQTTNTTSSYNADFGFQTGICQGQSSSFWSTSDWHFSNFEWIIDGVSVGTGSSLNYTFNTGGSHIVSLKAIESNGMSKTKNKTVNIQSKISAIQGVSQVCSNTANVIFSISNPPNGGYTWNTGGLAFTSSNGGTAISITSMKWPSTIEVSQSINGCWSSSSKSVSTFSCKQGQEITPSNDGQESTPNKNEFQIFPNPSSGIFNLQTEINGTYNVYSSDGRLIKTSSFNSGNNFLDLSNYSQGIYFIQIISNDFMTTSQLVIQQ